MKNVNIPSISVLGDKLHIIRAIQELYTYCKKLFLESANNEDVEALNESLRKANTEVYNLKVIVGGLGGSVTYEVPNNIGKSLTTLMGNDGTVKLTDDVQSGRYGPGILAKNKTTLNLNGYNITFTGLTVSSAQPAIMSRGNQEITIQGKGTIDAGGGIAIEANGANSTIYIKGGTTTTIQTNRPGAELVYCYAGNINISGGVFKNNGSPYLLNCYDANYRNGTAKITVTGGKFYDFDPGNNTAEGEGTSFLAEGYKSTETTVTEEGVEHRVYTVTKV